MQVAYGALSPSRFPYMAAKQAKLYENTVTGNGAQLGNNGGTISLMNPTGTRVHSVSYAKDDIGKQSRYIRFTT